MLGAVTEAAGSMLPGDLGTAVKVVGEGGPIGPLIDNSPINVLTKESAELANNTITGLGRDIAKAAIEKAEDLPYIGTAIKKMEHIGSSVVDGVEDGYHNAIDWIRGKFGLQKDPRTIKLDQVSNSEHNAANAFLREHINKLDDDNPFKQQMLNHRLLKDMDPNTSVSDGLRAKKYFKSIEDHPYFEYSRPGYYKLFERTNEIPAGAWQEYKITPSNSINGKIADLNEELSKNKNLRDYYGQLKRGGSTIENPTHLDSRLNEMLENPPSGLTPKQQQMLKTYGKKYHNGRFNITDTEGFNSDMPLKLQMEKMGYLGNHPNEFLVPKSGKLSATRFKNAFGDKLASTRRELPKAFVEAIVRNPNISIEEKNFLLKGLEDTKNVGDHLKQLRTAGSRLRIDNNPFLKPSEVNPLDENLLNKFRNAKPGEITQDQIAELEAEAEAEAMNPIKSTEPVARSPVVVDRVSTPVVPGESKTISDLANERMRQYETAPGTADLDDRFLTVGDDDISDFGVPSTMFSDKYLDSLKSGETDNPFKNTNTIDRIKNRYQQLKDSVFGIDYSGTPEMIPDETLLESLEDWENMDVVMDDVIEDLGGGEGTIADTSLTETQKIDKVAQLKKFLTSDQLGEIGTYVAGGIGLGAGGAILDKLANGADKIPVDSIKKLKDAYSKFKDLKEGYDMAKSIADEIRKAYNGAPNNTTRSRELKNKLNDVEQMINELSADIPRAAGGVVEVIKKTSNDLDETRNTMRQVQDLQGPGIPSRWKSNIMDNVPDEYGKYLAGPDRKGMMPVTVKIYNNNQSPGSFNKHKQYKYRLGHKIPLSYMPY